MNMDTESGTDVNELEKEKSDKPAKVDKSKAEKNGAGKTSGASDSYVLPVVGVRVQSKFVNAGFWGGLVGAAALGIVDPPLALFVGAGVVIARHKAKK
jgi:hypothetical protein